MTRTPSSLPARWTFELQSLARIIFGLLRMVAGFLFIHHGIEKVYGRVPLDITSLRAFAASLELVGGPMLMLGLFTRQVAFVLSGEMAFA